jgi:hypothetical protein
MAYRKVRVVDCLEVLRRWLARDGIRQIARSTGLDRKTVRRFVGVGAGLTQARRPLPDESVVGAFINRVKPRPAAAAPGGTEAVLLEHRDRIRHWLDEDRLLLSKVHELLARDGVLVPYPSLHRFARKWLDFGKRPSITVRKLDGQPGDYAEVDFGRLGYLQDLGSPKPRAVHGFIMMLGYSRLSCVVPVFRQDLQSVIHRPLLLPAFRHGGQPGNSNQHRQGAAQCRTSAEDIVICRPRRNGSASLIKK